MRSHNVITIHLSRTIHDIFTTIDETQAYLRLSGEKLIEYRKLSWVDGVKALQHFQDYGQFESHD